MHNTHIDIRKVILYT